MDFERIVEEVHYGGHFLKGISTEFLQKQTKESLKRKLSKEKLPKPISRRRFLKKLEGFLRLTGRREV